jgi:TonB-linked SusC/RagA family outer membrane protein
VNLEIIKSSRVITFRQKEAITHSASQCVLNQPEVRIMKNHLLRMPTLLLLWSLLVTTSAQGQALTLATSPRMSATDAEQTPERLALKASLDRLGEQYQVKKTSSAQPAKTIAQPRLLDKIISGTVTDGENGDELPGVNVVVKGTTIGTVTDVNGSYSLSAPDATETLVFSSVGYLTQEVAIGSRSTVDVAMEGDVKSLEEVVVVGYGTQEKKDLTGSVASVTAQELKQVPIASLDQGLQGRVSGVQVTQSSGRPGGGVSIRVRGASSINGGNEPLYVIDGFPIYNDGVDPGGVRGSFNPPNALSSINPNDIASIEILKDASATAIYGSRGANGVILVTTKRGKVGETRIDFEMYYGWQTLREKVDLLNAQEFLAFDRDARTNAGLPVIYPNDIATDTDWQDEVFRVAPQQNYQLSLSGGSEKTRYAISANYFDQQGIIKNSRFQRGALRANIDNSISEKLSVGLNLTASYNLNNGSNTDAHGNGQDGNGLTLFGVFKAVPVESPYGEDGNLTRFSPYTEDGLFGNPLFGVEDFVDETRTSRILANTFVDYDITPDLTLRVSVGANLFSLKRNTYQAGFRPNGNELSGEATVGTVINPQFLSENILTYRKNLGKNHALTLLGGFTAQTSLTESALASARDFPNDALLFNDLSAASTYLPPRSNKQSWSLASFLGRVNYSLMDRYLLTVPARADGSSRFGAGNKWGFFPSAALAWRVIEEGFMADQSFFSNLKIRGSIGKTGNQEIGTYQSLAAFTPVLYPIGDAGATGFAIDRVGNPELRWETTTQFDVGIDAGFADNRLIVTADYYHKTTNDLLFEVTLPYTTGFRNSLQNLGEIRNTGIELSLNADVLTGGFAWNVNGNISFNNNEILDLGTNQEVIVAIDREADAAILRVGEPIGSFFGYDYIGNFQQGDDIANLPVLAGLDQPGDPRFRDINTDGAINADDRVILGSAQPDYFYGVTNRFSYRGIDLNVFIQGVEGNSIHSEPVKHATNLATANQLAIVRDRWTPTNPSNSVPRANAVSSSEQRSVFTVQDGSFFRIKNITLGYNLPTEWLSRWSMRNARLYVSATNWITVTNYLGFDPEVGSFGQSSLAQGVDWGSYPPSKTLIVGLNIGL